MKNESEFQRLLKRQLDAPEPWTETNKDYRNTVHKMKGDIARDCDYRKEKAREEVSHPPVDRERVRQEWIKFLDYFEIRGEVFFNMKPLEMNAKNAIWGKFSQDEYLGVIARGPVNFQMPNKASEYDLKKYNADTCREEGWLYNSSGILVHCVGKRWNTDFILVCKIIDFPGRYTLVEIKRALGNWVLEAGISIIDKFSHQIDE